MVPDVDRYWKLCEEIKARVVAPIGNRYYGLRDFTVADPDGYGVRFATSLVDVKQVDPRSAAHDGGAPHQCYNRTDRLPRCQRRIALNTPMPPTSAHPVRE